jgi:hypothetical protein
MTVAWAFSCDNVRSLIVVRHNGPGVCFPSGTLNFQTHLPSLWADLPVRSSKSATRIDRARGERWFWSEVKARLAG